MSFGQRIVDPIVGTATFIRDELLLVEDGFGRNIAAAAAQIDAMYYRMLAELVDLKPT